MGSIGWVAIGADGAIACLIICRWTRLHRRSPHSICTDMREPAVGIEELHGDYTSWSSSKPMPLTRFQLEFDRARDLPDLAGKIRKFGDRYYGIALLAANSSSKQ